MENEFHSTLTNVDRKWEEENRGVHGAAQGRAYDLAVLGQVCEVHGREEPAPVLRLPRAPDERPAAGLLDEAQVDLGWDGEVAAEASKCGLGCFSEAALLAFKYQLIEEYALNTQETEGKGRDSFMERSQDDPTGRDGGRAAQVFCVWMNIHLDLGLSILII